MACTKNAVIVSLGGALVALPLGADRYSINMNILNLYNEFTSYKHYKGSDAYVCDDLIVVRIFKISKRTTLIITESYNYLIKGDEKLECALTNFSCLQVYSANTTIYIKVLQVYVFL